MAKTAGFLAVVMAALLTACSNDLPDADTSSVVTLPRSIATTPPSASSTAAPDSSDSNGDVISGGNGDSTSVGLRLVGTFDKPLAALARAGDPLLYLLERQGRVVPINPETGNPKRAVLDISTEVTTNGERGLLGGAFSPDGSVLYLHYSDSDGATQLHSWSVDSAGNVEAESRTPLYSLAQPFANHNGGQVAIGPEGYLYLGLGDGGRANDPLDAGQDPSTALGAILRIDPSGGDPYAIPADNPYVDGGGEPEIFLIGVRNPWRFSFDRATGDLWIGDVGQGELEEVTVLRAADGGGLGANLGWNLREGSQSFAGDEPSGHVGPIHEYDHSNNNCSITGGYVYRGAAIPALTGNYLYADYCVGELVAVSQSGQATPLGLVVDGREVVSFAEDNTGELYVISQSGQLFQLVVVKS